MWLDRKKYRFVRTHHFRAALGMAFVVTPLLLGGVHAEVNAALGMYLGSMLLLWLWLKGHRHPSPVTVPWMVVAAAFLLTALQLIPCPTFLVELLSPGTKGMFDLPTGVRPTFVSFSMDPSGTCHELLKLGVLFFGAWLGVLFFSGTRNQRSLFVWISLAGLTVVLVGLLHGLIRVDRPWGSYGPFAARHLLVSTFVNANHMAGFLGFASLLAFGLAVTAKGGVRFLHLGNAVVCGMGVFLSLSRGGILAFGACLVFLGAGLALVGRLPHKGMIWIELGAVAAILLAGFLGFATIANEMLSLGTDTAFQKTELLRPVASIMSDFPVLGVGKGGFLAIFPKYLPEELFYTFGHLENEWLQMLVDFGPFLGALLLLGFGFGFVLLLRRIAGDLLKVAAASALLFLILHNVTDFNLSITAVSLPAIVVFAVFSGPFPIHPGSFSLAKKISARGDLISGWWIKKSWAVVTSLVCMCVMILCVVPAIHQELPEDTRRLKRLFSDKNVPYEEVQKIILRHPADYFLPLLVAKQLLKNPESAQEALAWVNQSMKLSSNFPPAHRLAGRALLFLGATDQALWEYTMAVEKWPVQTLHIADELWTLTHNPQHVAKLYDKNQVVRRHIVRYLLKKDPQTALGVAIKDSYEHDPELVELAGELYLKLNQLEQAFKHAKLAESRWPKRENAYRLQAEVFFRQKQYEQAITVLDKGILKAGRNSNLWYKKAILYMQFSDDDRAKKAIKQLLESTSDPRTAATAHTLYGTLFERRRRFALALREYQRAEDFDSERLSIRLSIAKLKEQMGDKRGALQVLQRAEDELGASEVVSKEIQRISESWKRQEKRAF